MLLLAGPLVGCSGKYDALVRDVESLKTELGRMRTTNMVLQDRVDELEERTPTSDLAASAGGPEKAGDRPVLEVVTLTPQDQPGEAASPATQVDKVPEGDPRPTIVGNSDGVEQLAEGEEQTATPPGQKPKSKRGAR